MPLPVEQLCMRFRAFRDVPASALRCNCHANCALKIDAHNSTGKRISTGKGIELRLHYLISTGKGNTTTVYRVGTAGGRFVRVFTAIRRLCRKSLILFASRWLDRFLGPDQRGDEVVEVDGVDVADGDDAQVWRGGGVEGEA